MIYTCIRDTPRLDAFLERDSWSESDRRAFVEVAEEVIDHCSEMIGRKRFVRDESDYQYLVDSTIASDQPRFIVVIAQKSTLSQQCWSMIENIRLTRQTRESNECLVEEMRFFNANANANALLKVQSELNETKSIMLSNMEQLLDRSERIEDISDTADVLLREAGHFERSSKKVKQAQAKKAFLWASACIILAIGMFLFLGGGTLLFFLLRKPK